MIHPSPRDQLDPSFQARSSFTVEYFGKESHAAFAPQQGVNALDAFVQAYMSVATLRQQILPTWPGRKAFSRGRRPAPTSRSRSGSPGGWAVGGRS
jgi:hypothetical protein